MTAGSEDDVFTHEMTPGTAMEYYSATKQGKISFLNYTFNPALRTLQRDDVIQQLRKKQSDVLALLCAKYPSPVSQDEFLTEVWDRSYVTSQSIAQMIRSLRIILNDESKNIIVTIPKLGYQLTAEPTWQTPESLPEPLQDKLNAHNTEVGDISLDNDSFSANPITYFQPSPPATSMTAASYAPQHKSIGRKAASRKWLLFAIAILSPILIGVAMAAKGYTLSSFDEKKVLLSGALLCSAEPAQNDE